MTDAARSSTATPVSPAALAAAVRALAAAAPRFDDDAAHAARHAALQRLAAAPLVAGASLRRACELLLFLAAHPSDAAMATQVDRQFTRIARWLKARRGDVPAALLNQGLPFVDTVTRFSHDGLRWLLAHPQLRVAPEASGAPRQALGEVLALTLPALERGLTTAGLDDDELLHALGVAPSRRLAFIVEQLAAFDAQPLLKDRLFDGLDLYVRVTPTHAAFSKAGNRLPMAGRFHQRERLRRFDPPALMNQPLPPPRALDGAARNATVQLLKNVMALTARETDPATHLDPATLQLFDLERGLSVALFGMVPARQLPLESYVGFTLFKNGLAVAYGGAWLLGARADFGMNIFEPYRGGESGLMMCQVLRAYRQAFGIDSFEVDAHQFGLDNPDGIASGAFWFYHRHGFRPLDAALARRAEAERRRLDQRPGLRSSAQTLRAFTGSNVALNFGPGAPPPAVGEYAACVTRWVQRQHRGQRAEALADALRRFEAATGPLAGLSADEQRVLPELAMLAAALPVTDAPRLALLRRLVHARPVDLAQVQRLWRAFQGR